MFGRIFLTGIAFPALDAASAFSIAALFMTLPGAGLLLVSDSRAGVGAVTASVSAALSSNFLT